MGQSNVIAGFLILAFLVFITVKGELPVYMGFLLADPAGGALKATGEPQTAQARTDAQNAANLKTATTAIKTIASIV